MGRLIKTIRNIVLTIFFMTFIILFSGIRLTPVGAHIFSEKSIHYGPSKIIKIFNHGDYQHLLCKYDCWISCNTVNRMLYFFWSIGDQPIGFENDMSKSINYSGRFSHGDNYIYGVVNNPDIKKIELHISEGNVIEHGSFYDNLFYFYWESDGSDWGIEKIVGYNSKGEILEEVLRP